MRLLLVGALLATGCTRDEPEETDEAVIEGPSLDHTPPEGPFVEGDEIPLLVTATDPDGVGSVEVWYRGYGSAAWESLALEGDGDSWTATLPGEAAVSPLVEYYFKAADESEFNVSSSLPASGRSDPFEVEVGVVGLELPYVEDFEGDVGVTDVYGHGWAEYVLGDKGYNWALSSSRAVSGTVSVAHKRGQSDRSYEDWLVSPPLDLSTVERAQVTWYEYGDDASSGTHSLWASVGSRDPADGAYELVAELDNPPEDDWERTQVHDLSAYAGEEVVYLAWLYEGGKADAWFIDDVAVKELGPDLHLVDVSWDTVDPGGTTTVSLTIENRTDVAAEDALLYPTVDTTLAVFDDETVDIGTIDGDTSVVVDLTLTVDPTHPDNAYLPFTLDVETASETWNWDTQLVVGEASTGFLDFTVESSGLVQILLGVGDPDEPTILFYATAKTYAAGDHQLEVDLTDYYDYLPPAAGELRWFAELQSAGAGTLDRFDISYEAATYSSDDTGAFEADTETVFYLPRPPAPAVDTSETDPETIAPGDTVDWTLSLVNEGASTTGLTTATVTSDDPDVTILTVDPVEISADGWAEDEVVSLPLQFTVADTQVDSTPILFTVTITDEAESFELDAEVEVPWPVLNITKLLVDDWADGDDDGLLDPGETANLEISLTNLGGLDTFSAVYCTLAQTGGTATLSVLEPDGAFGLVRTTDTKTEDDFEVEVTSGSVGDNAELELTCTDGTVTYVIASEIVLGEAPWLSLSVFDDPAGDAVGGYGFDYLNGQYRFDGSTLEIVLESYVEIDESTLFLEMWGISTGATYTYYRFVFQSGKGDLDGYRSGVFTDLSKPTIELVDDKTVLLTIDVDSMGLTLDTLKLGFAAGFCTDTYYCDHFPDSWGSPYVLMYTSLWITMSW